MSELDEFSGFTKAFVEEPITSEPAPITEPASTETVVTETAQPATPEPVQTDFWSSLNEKLKTDFKSEDDIRSLIENSSKVKTLEEQLKDFDTLKADIEFYKESADPLKHFANEDEYRLQQFRKSNPEKDSSVAYQVFTSDIDKLSDLDVLAKYELLNNEVEGGDAGAKELVAQQYSLDLESDPKDWSTLSRNQLKKAANLVRKEFKDLKESYKLPEKVDLASKRQSDQQAIAQRKELIEKGWTEVIPKALNEIKEIEINDTDKDGNVEPLMKYVIDEDLKKELGEEAKQILLANNVDINAESGKFIDKYIKDQYVTRTLPKILKAYATTLMAELDAKRDKEIHNPTPIKTDPRPASADDTEKQRLIDYALGGGGFKYNKPFN